VDDLHRKVKPGEGWHGVVKRSEMKYLDLGLLRLGRGQEETLGGRLHETVVVLTSGQCDAFVDDSRKAERLERANVFDAMPWAIYLPAHHKVRIKAKKPTELIVSTAPASGKRDLAVRIIAPDQVKPVTRGSGNFEREIRNLIVSTDDTEHVVFGETINGPGNWSSYPPHKHDTNNPPTEYALEEIYLYKFHPPQGFGFQRVYTQGRKSDQTFLIENDHVVLLKKGYHPVVAAGGYKLYYFWIIAGAQARLCFVDDPEHAWVKQWEPGAPLPPPAAAKQAKPEKAPIQAAPKSPKKTAPGRK